MVKYGLPKQHRRADTCDEEIAATALDLLEYMFLSPVGVVHARYRLLSPETIVFGTDIVLRVVHCSRLFIVP